MDLLPAINFVSLPPLIFAQSRLDCNDTPFALGGLPPFLYAISYRTHLFQPAPFDYHGA